MKKDEHEYQKDLVKSMPVLMKVLCTKIKRSEPPIQIYGYECFQANFYDEGPPDPRIRYDIYATHDGGKVMVEEEGDDYLDEKYKEFKGKRQPYQKDKTIRFSPRRMYGLYDSNINGDGSAPDIVKSLLKHLSKR